jgi:ubiquinone/menaquinone biosynthesis C-methylase UbiE
MLEPLRTMHVRAMSLTDRFWARIERLFWSLQSYTWDDYLQLPEFRDEVQATAQLLADKLGGTSRRVLDVGCGTGNYALAFAEQDCEVVGIDFARGMLARARTKAQRSPASRVTFESADFNQGLPFSAHSFDGAIGVAVLQCAADPEQFLGEVARVLRPAGLFLLVAIDSSQRPMAKRKLRTTPLKWVLRQIKAIGNRSRTVRKYGRSELLALLRSASLEVLEESVSGSTIKLLARVRDSG